MVLKNIAETPQKSLSIDALSNLVWVRVKNSAKNRVADSLEGKSFVRNFSDL